MSNNWQPIETAPRDGTQIIAFVPFVITPHAKSKQRTHAHLPQVHSVYWSHYEENPVRPITPRAQILDKHHGGYWSLDKKGRKPLYAAPTHWMPFELPELPRKVIDV